MINLEGLRPAPERPPYEHPWATDQEVKDLFHRTLERFERK